MDKNEKEGSEKKFREGEFVFPFGNCEKMAKMMRRFCAGESGMADCCSMMKKMMGAMRGNRRQRRQSRPK